MAIAHAGQTIPIIPSPTEIPFFLPPEAESVFSGRALRLKQLAEGHAMGDYLRFMAGIAQAQAEALSSLPELLMPALAAELPPLSAAWMQPSAMSTGSSPTVAWVMASGRSRNRTSQVPSGSGSMRAG